MTELVQVSLENEMDLILAYKKSIKTAELLGLSLSTQTSFATAVSEVCREVIDNAFDGLARLGVFKDGNRYFLMARITFREDENLKGLREGFQYAQRLVPVFDLHTGNGMVVVELKLGIPRAFRVDPQRIQVVKTHFESEGPSSPYEEVKLKNIELFKVNERQENALLHAHYLNEQKTEFLSVASHELRTPLTILRSFTQLAIKIEGGGNQVLSNYLKKIELQTTKLNHLIQQLLDISKIEAGQAEYRMEEVELNRYLHDTTELIRQLIPHHELSVNMTTGADLKVHIDQLRMEQVLNNLISNAAKYSRSGSSIQMKVWAEQHHVCISIEDQGIGMSADTIAKVFEKFYRNEEIIKKYNGLGMGLYIASKIVNDHQGSITVKSEVGKGSQFTFTIPLAANL
jgi:signal transduction histidine kinase